MTYTIYFMRGDIKEIVADSASQACKLCARKYPETAAYDVLKILDENGEEV